MKSHHQMLVWLFIIIAPLALWAILTAFRRRAIDQLYRHYFRDPRRERVFLSSVAFYLTFAVVRYITRSIHLGRGPFRNIYFEGLHVHHLVIGIVLILGVGYLWLMGVGTGEADRSRWPSRATSMLYGLGAALTLDEFALWLRLEDVYWSREGRASIDAVFLFGSLLMISVAGATFFRALLRLSLRLIGVGKALSGE